MTAESFQRPGPAVYSDTKAQAAAKTSFTQLASGEHRHVSCGTNVASSSGAWATLETPTSRLNGSALHFVPANTGMMSSLTLPSPHPPGIAGLFSSSVMPQDLPPSAASPWPLAASPWSNTNNAPPPGMKLFNLSTRDAPRQALSQGLWAPELGPLANSASESPLSQGPPTGTFIPPSPEFPTQPSFKDSLAIPSALQGSRAGWAGGAAGPAPQTPVISAAMSAWASNMLPTAPYSLASMYGTRTTSSTSSDDSPSDTTRPTMTAPIVSTVPVPAPPDSRAAPQPTKPARIPTPRGSPPNHTPFTSTPRSQHKELGSPPLPWQGQGGVTASSEVEETLRRGLTHTNSMPMGRRGLQTRQSSAGTISASGTPLQTPLATPSRNPSRSRSWGAEAPPVSMEQFKERIAVVLPADGSAMSGYHVIQGYKECFDASIPVKQLGYEKLVLLMQAVPDVVVVKQLPLAAEYYLASAYKDKPTKTPARSSTPGLQSSATLPDTLSINSDPPAEDVQPPSTALRKRILALLPLDGTRVTARSLGSAYLKEYGASLQSAAQRRGYRKVFSLMQAMQDEILITVSDGETSYSYRRVGLRGSSNDGGSFEPDSDPARGRSGTTDSGGGFPSDISPRGSESGGEDYGSAQGQPTGPLSYAEVARIGRNSRGTSPVAPPMQPPAAVSGRTPSMTHVTLGPAGRMFPKEGTAASASAGQTSPLPEARSERGHNGHALEISQPEDYTSDVARERVARAQLGRDLLLSQADGREETHSHLDSCPLVDERALQHLSSWGLLGKISDSPGDADEAFCGQPATAVPVYLNTDRPFCLVVAGSQDADRVETVSVVLEVCCVPRDIPGVLQGGDGGGMAAMVFHYQKGDAGNCPAGCSFLTAPSPRLPSGLSAAVQHTTVFVSPCYLEQKRQQYRQRPNTEVRPLLLRWSDLDLPQLACLLGVHQEASSAPGALVLRRFFRAQQRADSFPPSLVDFRRQLSGFNEGELLAGCEDALATLESILAPTESEQGPDGPLAAMQAGCLVLVDLSDPMLVPREANAVFQVLAMQLRSWAQSSSGLTPAVLVLEGAHQFAAAEQGGLMDVTLGIASQVQDTGLSVIVSGQTAACAPPELLELADLVCVHRLHSRAWVQRLGQFTGLGDQALTSLASLQPRAAMVYSSLWSLQGYVTGGAQLRTGIRHMHIRELLTTPPGSATNPYPMTLDDLAGPPRTSSSPTVPPTEEIPSISAASDHSHSGCNDSASNSRTTSGASTGQDVTAPHSA